MNSFKDIKFLKTIFWYWVFLGGHVLMRMFVASDFHGTLEAVKAVKEFAMAEKVDCIVLTGDITNFGTVNLAYKIINDLAQTKAPVLYVPGNCDPPELANFEKEKVNGFCLHGRGTRVKNVAFIGVGGSPPTPFETPFEITEKEILEVLEKGLKDVAIQNGVVVSHSPPYGSSLDLTRMGIHAGSKNVRKFITEKRPALLLCGHIHEAKGVEKIKNTTCINVGPAQSGDAAIIEIDSMGGNVGYKPIFLFP